MASTSTKISSSSHSPPPLRWMKPLWCSHRLQRQRVLILERSREFPACRCWENWVRIDYVNREPKAMVAFPELVLGAVLQHEAREEWMESQTRLVQFGKAKQL